MSKYLNCRELPFGDDERLVHKVYAHGAHVRGTKARQSHQENGAKRVSRRFLNILKFFYRIVMKCCTPIQVIPWPLWVAPLALLSKENSRVQVTSRRLQGLPNSKGRSRFLEPERRADARAAGADREEGKLGAAQREAE